MPEGSSNPSDSKAARLRHEIFRKSIHIVGFVVPFIAIGLGIVAAALFLVIMSVLYCISEYLRLRGRHFPLLTTVTKLAMRSSNSAESRDSFTIAPLYFSAGILASLLIFPSPVNYVAIAVLTLGDGTAAIVGRLAGRSQIPYSQGKTVEGTIAGFVCAFGGSLIFVPPMVAAVAASVGMLIELLPLRVSDNLTVPLVAGLAAFLVVMIQA